MASDATIRLTVSFAWWLQPYLHGVILTSTVTGLEPDWDKVYRLVIRAVRLRVA